MAQPTTAKTNKVMGPAAVPSTIVDLTGDRPRLLRDGAGEILADVQRAHAAVEGIQP